jgi:hypothetical protein
MPPSQPQEIILEVTRIGSSLRVTAIDTATGTEAVFQAPVQASEAEIRSIARNKINYVLRREKE